MAWPGPALVVVRQKLGLVSRHVHVNGTFAFATLAGQAQIKRILDGFALPTIGQHLAVHHLKQQMRPAARAVFLLACHLIAGTHDLTALFAALADADAAKSRPRERSLVFRVMEVRGWLWRIVVRANAQILRGTVGVDFLAWIHLPFRIPNGFEFAEGLIQRLSEHLGQEHAAGLTITVFAGHRAAVAYDKVAGFFEEVAPILDPFSRVEIESDAAMNAALTEMAIQGGMVAE